MYDIIGEVKKALGFEVEYYSECCDAPPYSYEEVNVDVKRLGHCQQCGEGVEFYINNKEGKSDNEKTK